MLKRQRRSVRDPVNERALALLSRHGAQILATARRYAATPQDAEDAYQRGLEILLTKAPTSNEDDLVPWLKTVVKHEAFALRRQRDRHSPLSDDGEVGDHPTPAAATHEQAERLERLQQGAEALRQLKPQEIRCLLLRAEGYSYREICDLTGFSYTKVNRSLTEGRQSLSVRLAGIEGGIECAKLAPLLSALSDGEAKAEDLALLRPHLKTCLSCRARLREFREAPTRVAALLPPAALAAADEGSGFRVLLESAAAAAQQKAEALLGAAQQKASAFGERAHAAAELATGQKAAAVAASAAALAGGGTAVDQFATHDAPAASPPAVERAEENVVKNEPAVEPAPAEPAPAEQPAAEPAPAPAPAPQPAPPPAPPPDPANEFDPATATATAPPQAPAPAPAPAAPSPPTGGGSTAGGGEFGP